MLLIYSCVKTVLPVMIPDCRTFERGGPTKNGTCRKSLQFSKNTFKMSLSIIKRKRRVGNSSGGHYLNRVEWKIILLFKSSNCISCWSVEQLKSPPTDSRLTKLDPRNSIGTHSTPISPVYRVASKLQFFPSSHAAWTLFLLTLCCVGKSNFISIAGPQLEIGTIDVEKVNDFNSPGVSCRENVQFGL